MKTFLLLAVILCCSAVRADDHTDNIAVAKQIIALMAETQRRLKQIGPVF